MNLPDIIVYIKLSLQVKLKFESLLFAIYSWVNLTKKNIKIFNNHILRSFVI